MFFKDSAEINIKEKKKNLWRETRQEGLVSRV
jgi:hypothetical protein